MKKASCVIAVLIMMMALVLTGCGDMAGGATVFKVEHDGITKTITFNTDGTCFAHEKGIQDGIYGDITIFSGTYTGNPKADGILTLTVTKSVDFNNYPRSATILTNENCPLIDITPETITFVVSNGRISGMGTNNGRISGIGANGKQFIRQ
ncbi:MAG: hypothetical protein K5751_00520 [Treponemataceae bacterium]|nr:hypothetical protein [Treponemataceae bacterium]